MPANTFPIYPIIPHVEIMSFGSVANTNYDGTGTLADAFIAVANGSRLDTLRLKPQGTCPARKITVFYYSAVNTQIKFMGEVPCDATTGSTSEENGPMIDVLEAIGYGGGIAMYPGDRIKLGSTIANSVQDSSIAAGGDY